jgi:alpha-L-fucosidase
VGVVGGPAPVDGSPSAVVELTGRRACVLGCRVDGHVVARADDTRVRASSAAGVVADGAERVTVSRCQLDGNRWDVGIHLVGGNGHEIDSCDVHDHLCAVRVSDAAGVELRGNNLSARWWGVHLQRTEGAHVHANMVHHTMRGIDVDGGTQALIDGNAVCDGDSGCIVQWGAADCRVTGNRWERCRIGVMAWDASRLVEQSNESIDLHDTDAAFVSGP